MAEHLRTVVRIPKELKEAAIKSVRDATGFSPVFEDFVHIAIKHEMERYTKQKKLPRTGTD